MKEYASELLKNFGYEHLFETFKSNDGQFHHTSTDIISSAAGTGDKSWIREFNAKNLKESIKILYEADEVTSIMINHPSLLLRKKSVMYPEGRTSYRFKKDLRKLVTVSGVSAFAPKKKKMKTAYKPSELDLPETDEPEEYEMPKKTKKTPALDPVDPISSIPF